MEVTSVLICSGSVETAQKQEGTFWGIEMFYILMGVMVTEVHTYNRSHQAACLKQYYIQKKYVSQQR